MVGALDQQREAAGGAGTLYIVDGTSQLFRAYFAIRGLSNRQGLPTNAIYGFTSMLRKLLHDERPTHLAVAFDPPGRVFRHERFAAYKANRPPAPDDLARQVPYAKQVCDVLGVRVLEREGYEADDLIAAYSDAARRAGFDVVVVASDKDLLQLVDEHVTVLNPTKNVRLDPAGVLGSFGAPPERVRDVLGLMGDSVDNIPGVPGVGEKTALSIVSLYGDVETVIERAARFAQLIEARDALVREIDGVRARTPLEVASSQGWVAAGERLTRSLAGLLEVEADEEMRQKLRGLERLVSESAFVALNARAGQPGAVSARPLLGLKRELRELDRGSSKRIWLAIHGYADQLRLSRELVGLDHEAPVDFHPTQLSLAAPDPVRAHALFSSLDFKALTEEFARLDPGVVAAAETCRGSYSAVLVRARLDEIAALCARSGRVSVLAVTDSHDPLQGRLVGIALACRPGEAVYVPIAHDYLGVPSQISLDSVREALGGLLADPAIGKVGHDLKRHSHVLERHGLPLVGWSMDTMVAGFLLNPGRSSYSIGSLVREYLGDMKLVREEHVAGAPSPNHIEIDRAADGSAEESDLALQLALVLEDRLKEAGLLELYRNVDGPLLPLLARMEAHGIHVDTSLLRRMSAEMEATLDRLRAQIHTLAGAEFNIDSPKQLREVLFHQLGLTPRRKTVKSRADSTDAQTLEQLAGEHEIARVMLDYRELAKLKGTYADSLPRLVNPETGRVHTSFHPTGAATGRLSSSDPNLQNIPARTEAGRKIRAAFVPEEGFLFLASDYSQIELRVLAHLCGDPELLGAFKAGEDIHRHTAARIVGVAPELVTDALRRRAKAINFGILYGMSETRLAREQGISRLDARRFIAAYFERFGKVREYIDAVRDQARREGAVRTLFGRVRRFPDLHQRVNRAVQEQALRAAVNTTIQGTAADLMKLAMLRVDAALQRAGLEARMLLQVHDELLLEVPREQVEPVRSVVKQAMETVHPLAVPLVVDQKIGGSWLEVT